MCGTCSNVSIPVIAGPPGPAGATGQTGPAGTISIGTVTALPNGSSPTVTNSGTSTAAVLDFELETGPQGDTGPAGTSGVVLIDTITAPVEVTSTSYSTANAIGGSPWSVPSDTLQDVGDTLRLELTVLPLSNDSHYTSIQVLVGSGSVPVRFTTSSPYDLKFPSFFYYTVQIDLIRASDTTLKVEWKHSFEQQYLSDYANAEARSLSQGINSTAAKANQTITVPSLAANATPIDVQLEVTNSSYPAKLIMGKLYFFKKL